MFVATLAASSHTFVDLTPTRKLEDWTGPHVRMFEFWDRAVELLIPDNEKAGVRRACRYEPELNPTYLEIARHYEVVVLPTRPRLPGDGRRSRRQCSTSSGGCSRRCATTASSRCPKRAKRSRRWSRRSTSGRSRKIEGSRQNLFEKLDRPALRPLPALRYEFARWVKARVNVDYHVQIGGCFYSVPYTLARKEVDVRVSATTVEVFHRSKRQAAHVRKREGERVRGPDYYKDSTPDEES